MKRDDLDIYNDYYDKIFGYICTRVSDREVAEDLCEAVIVKIYEKIDEFNEEKASLSTWIFAITRNTIIDFYRTRHISGEIDENIPSEEITEEVVIKKDELQMLTKALEQLTPTERDVIILHYYSGYMLKDIAKKMGFSYSYIKRIHKDSLKKLKEIL